MNFNTLLFPVDFNGKNYKDVIKIKNYLEEYRNTLVKSQASTSASANNNGDELKLRELLSLTLSKWDRLHGQYKIIVNMVKPKKKSKHEFVSPKKVEIQKSSPENTIEKSQKCKRCSLQMCTSRLHSNGLTNSMRNLP